MDNTVQLFATGIELLGWSTETPAETMRISDDLKALAEFQFISQLEEQMQEPRT